MWQFFKKHRLPQVFRVESNVALVGSFAYVAVLIVVLGAAVLFGL
jgi:hypothetical protein